MSGDEKGLQSLSLMSPLESGGRKKKESPPSVSQRAGPASHQDAHNGVPPNKEGVSEALQPKPPQQTSLYSFCWACLLLIFLFPLGHRPCVFFFFFPLYFRATPAAYGGSQAGGRIGATAASRSHSHSHSNWGIRATSATYTTAHGHARSLTH